jgi:peptide/nickel transport system substrate-binding protein
MFTTAYASGASWNDSFWSNEASTSFSSPPGPRSTRQAPRDVPGDAAHRVLRGLGHHPDVQQLRHGRVDKVATPEKISANWNLDGFRCVERWWFA